MLMGTAGNTLIIGLCHENIDRLKAGSPILINKDKHRLGEALKSLGDDPQILIHVEPSMGDLIAWGQSLEAEVNKAE